MKPNRYHCPFLGQFWNSKTELWNFQKATNWLWIVLQFVQNWQESDKAGKCLQWFQKKPRNACYLIINLIFTLLTEPMVFTNTEDPTLAVKMTYLQHKIYHNQQSTLDLSLRVTYRTATQTVKLQSSNLLMHQNLQVWDIKYRHVDKQQLSLWEQQTQAQTLYFPIRPLGQVYFERKAKCQMDCRKTSKRKTVHRPCIGSHTTHTDDYKLNSTKVIRNLMIFHFFEQISTTLPLRPHGRFSPAN